MDKEAIEKEAQLFIMGMMHERIAERRHKFFQFMAFGVLTFILGIIAIIGILYIPGSFITGSLFAAAFAVTAVTGVDWYEARIRTQDYIKEKI